MEKEVRPLPIYKSNEYFLEFTVEWEKDFSVFKNRGEITSEIEVELERDNSSYSDDEKKIYLHWRRHTLHGKEWISLGKIKPTESFLIFLDKFFVEGNDKLFGTNKFKTKDKWSMVLGTLSLACKLCESDPHEFEKMVIRAKNKEDLLIQLGVS